MPPRVRRTLSLRGLAVLGRPGDGGCRRCRERRLHAARRALAERARASTRRTTSSSASRRRSSCSSRARCRLRRQVQKPRPRPRRSRAPQVHGHTRLELIWTVIPVLILAVIVGVRLLQAAGHLRRAGGERGRPAAHHGRGPPVLLAVRLPERRRLDRRRCTAGRTRRRADGQRRGRHPQLVDPGARRQDRTRSPAGRTACGSSRRRSARTTASAPSSAVSTTSDARARRRDEQADYTAWTTTAAKTSSAKMEWQGVCATCHGMQGQGGYGPHLANEPAAHPARGSRADRPQRVAGRCRPSGATGRRRRCARSRPT